MLVVKNPFASAGDKTDMGWIPELGRSSPIRNGIFLQYSCLENSMDRGARQASVHLVMKSWTQLSTHRTGSRKCSLQRVGSIQAESHFSSFTGMQPHLSVCILFMTAFLLHLLPWVIAMEIMWPTNPKIFTVWSFKKKIFPPPAPENVLQHLSCLGTYKKIITQHIGTNKWNVCKLSQVKVRKGEGTITLLVLEISPSLFTSNTYSPVSRAFNSVVSCFPCIINPLPDLLLWFLFSLSNIFWEEITLTI